MSYVLKAKKFRIPSVAPEAQVDVPPIRIKEITDIILHGNIYECDGITPVKCALVKIFGPENVAYHTFTDEYGQYLFNIPYEWKNKEVLIKAVKTNRKINCACPIYPTAPAE